MESEPVATIRLGIALFNEGEYERAIAELAPEIEWDTTDAVPDGSVHAGADAVVTYWRGIAERWEDFRIEVERTIEGDGVVLVLGRLNGRGVDSGVPVENTWDQVWTIEGGAPIRCRNFTDRGRAFQAAGLEPES